MTRRLEYNIHTTGIQTRRTRLIREGLDHFERRAFQVIERFRDVIPPWTSGNDLSILIEKPSQEALEALGKLTVLKRDREIDLW